MAIKTSDFTLLGLHTQWVEDSQFRIRVRKMAKSGKFLVDVTELTHGRISQQRTALKLAREFVRQFGPASVDATILSDFRFTKKSFTIDGKECRVKIRHSEFVFHGTED